MNAPSSPGKSIVVERNKRELQASGDASRPIVVVLGMHRSGTSLCSHVLSMLGVDMADELLINSGNEKGHWERLEIMALQDEILNLLDRGYSTPQHDFPLPAAWWAEPKVRDVQATIENFLTGKMKANGLFGFKDPRTARLLPLWLKIFRNLNLAPKFVLCLRAPSQIARSLQRRDGLDTVAGEYRSLTYLVDCFRYIPHHDICIVEYEEWFENYSDNLHGLMDFVNIEWDQSEADLGVAVSSIVDRDLRHTEERLGIAKQPLVRSFYNLAIASRKDPSRRSEIDRFVNQFVAFQQLLQPFEQAQRQLGDVVARASETQARIAELEAGLQASEAGGQQREETLRKELTARERELESIHIALAELGREEQSLRISNNDAREELKAAREDLSAIKRREQQAEETGARLRSELTIAMANRSTAQERLTGMKVRLAALETALGVADSTARQGEKTLSDTLAAHRSEVEAANTALQESRRQEQETRASNEIAHRRFETQILALREQLIDTDAALAKSNAKQSRPLLSRGSRGSERKLMRSGLFDAEWYKDQHKDVIESGLSPVAHYLEKGCLRGYRPNPFFDTRWYLERNEDVRRSGVNPLLHYLLHGAQEGRDPGPDFQTGFYLAANPDVRDSGINPLAHYLQKGRHEGRQPTKPV